MRANHRCLVTAKIILLADEFVVVQNVQFFTGGKLFPAHETGETIEMEHFVSSFPH